MSRMVAEHIEALANQFSGKNTDYFVMANKKDENLGLLHISEAAFFAPLMCNTLIIRKNRNGTGITNSQLIACELQIRKNKRTETTALQTYFPQ